MSLAERTREAVDERPFLRDALRAGVCNYTATARFLGVDGDEDAVATALRRYADDLPAFAAAPREVRVTMERGLERVDDPAEALLVAGDAALAPGGDGSLTGVLAAGDVDPVALGTVLRRLSAAGVAVEAAATADDALVVAVPRRAGADAVRTVEGALVAVPTRDH